MSSIGGIDSSVLLGFYQTQLSSSASSISAANAQNAALAATQAKGATAADNPPWNTPNTNDAKQDAAVLSTTNFLDTSKVPLSAGATTDSKMEQDNQKLFALYSAVNTLAYISKMAQSSTATSGQLAGLNARFQTGLAQVQSYLTSTSFNNFNLQAAKPSNTVSSTANIAFSDYTYSTKQLVSNAQLDSAMPGLSSSSSFTIAIKKGGATTNVPIDLSQVSGTLNLTNIVSYINGQLSAAGFATRFQKTQQGGTTTSDATATYGLQITPGGTEQVSLSAASAPSLYLAGDSGLATETNTVTNSATSATTTSAADQAGRLTKLSGLDGSSPTATFSVNQANVGGITSASATAVDSSGNVYVIGTSTGDFGTSQINQGSQDTYLTKYDSAGNVVWQNLLGSGGTANAYGLALDPSGGVVVTGASTSQLMTSSVSNGNNDSFVARYDTNGEQSWIKQIQTLATNQSNAVSVDASGNIYIGGSVSGGVIGAGQTAQGGGDAFLVKLNSKGVVQAENQFGTSGSDSVGATATDASGNLFVASTQNGHAVVSKYANGDITSAPLWTQDLGALQAGGAIGGLTVSNGKVYVSGATSNPNLTGGGATVATPASGGIDAFVASLTDNGSSVTANTVSYIGTANTDTAGAVTVGPDGTVYVAGTTTGTFAGAQRSVQNVNNAFASALNADGTVKWTKQFGGADGVSSGAGLAVDIQGSSVLDALGLPRGAITLSQSVDLTNQTTLRAGDSFQLQIQGTAARTATITIDQGETYDSLATKINAQLGTIGKAAVAYGSAGETMSLTINAGQTVNLVAGPGNFDALSRLGMSAGVLTAPATGSKTTTSTTATNSTSTVKTTYGLGLTGGISGPLDISTKTGADMARSTLLGVLSSLQSTYQTTNTPTPTSTKVGNTSGTANSATVSQLSNYSMALSLMNADPSNAVANIQQIIAGGGSSSASSSLLSALQGLGG
jgi:hypothetical protein